MKVYFTDQQSKLGQHLDRLKTKEVMRYALPQLAEKSAAVNINTSKSLAQLDLAFFFNYQVFPSNILTYRTQWTHESRTIAVGDTIVQQIYLPPIKWLSQKIIVGVRVRAIIDQIHRKGFVYETLEGHVEKGVARFSIEQVDDAIIAKIHTHSTPGNFLSQLAASLFTNRYQAYCTRQALLNIKQQLEMQ